MKKLLIQLALFFMNVEITLAAIPGCEDYGHSSENCYRSTSVIDYLISGAVLLIVGAYVSYNLLTSKNARKFGVGSLILFGTLIFSEYIAFQSAGKVGVIGVSLAWVLVGKKINDWIWVVLDMGISGEDKNPTKSNNTEEIIRDKSNVTGSSRSIEDPSEAINKNMNFVSSDIKRKTSEEMRRDSFKQRYENARVVAKNYSARDIATEAKGNEKKISLSERFLPSDTPRSKTAVEEIKNPKQAEVKGILIKESDHKISMVFDESTKIKEVFTKSIDCHVCRYSFKVDLLEREATCPNCRQYIVIS